MGIENTDLAINEKKKINISILISLLTLIFSFLTSFLFTKFLLQQPQIGDVNYGLKVTASSFVSFISIFTMGMSTTFIRFHKKYQNDENSIVHTFNLITLIVSIVAIIFGFIVFILAINNIILNPKDGVYTQKQVYEFSAILAISILYFALSILLSNSQWFLESCKHIVLVRLVNLIVVILYPLISIIFVLLGGGMVVVTIVYSAVYLAGFLFLFFIRLKKSKSTSFMKISIRKDLLKEILIFSFFVVISSASQSFSFSFDKAILTIALSASLTTIYQLGITLNQVMLSVIQLIYSPYAPYIADDISNDRKENIQKTYNKVCLILLLISFFIFVGFASCGKEFVLLWVGKDKETVYYFGMILFGLWPLYSVAMFSTSIQRLYGKHYKSTIFFVASILIHIILTSSLIKVINIWACILGLSISYLFLGVSMLIYNKKILNINQTDYLINLLKTSICAGGSFGLTYLFVHLIKSSNTLTTTQLFLIEGILSVLIFLFLLAILYYKNTFKFLRRTFDNKYCIKNYCCNSYFYNFSLKLQLKKDSINNIFPYIIIVYFIFNFASYYLGGISQINGFVNSTAFSLITKLVSYSILIVYILIYSISNKCKIKLGYLFGFSSIFLISILSSLLIPKNMIFYITNDYKWLIRVTINIGIKNILIDELNWLIDLIFMFSFIFLFRKGIRKRHLKPFFLFIVLFATIEIFYSFIFQYNQYLYFIGKGNVKNPNLSATFSSKNGFGILLFQSVIACYFLICETKDKKRIIYWILFLLINLITILSLCKTSIVTVLIFDLVIFIYWLIKIRRIKKLTFYLTLAGTVCLISFIILLFTPVFSNVPLISKFTKKIINILNFGEATIKSRIKIWNDALKLFRSPFLIIGYGKTCSTYLLDVAHNLNTFTFHSGFLSVLCSHGIIGLTFYLISICYVGKRIIKTYSSYKIALITIMVVSLLYGLMENVYLFISSSSAMLVPCVILSLDYKEFPQRRLELNEETIQ